MGISGGKCPPLPYPLTIRSTFCGCYSYTSQRPDQPYQVRLFGDRVSEQFAQRCYMTVERSRVSDPWFTNLPSLTFHQHATHYSHT